MKKIICLIIGMCLFSANVYAEDRVIDVFEEYAVSEEECKTFPMALTTAKNTEIKSTFLTECDEDYYVEITKHPKLGTLKINGKEFIYTPKKGKTGKDCFYYRIVTGKYISNISKCTVVIESEKKKVKAASTKFSYADMQNDPHREAAEKMVEMNVIKGERIGSEYYFRPNDNVTRETALNCINHILMLGTDNINNAVLSKFKDKGRLNERTKQNASIACSAGILSGKTIDNECYFCPDDNITRIEFISMLDRAIGGKTMSDIDLTYRDTSSIPDYAKISVKNLKGYEMLEVFGYDLLEPNKELTRAEFAELLYSTAKKVRESTQKTLSQRIKEGFYGKIIT